MKKRFFKLILAMLLAFSNLNVIWAQENSGSSVTDEGTIGDEAHWSYYSSAEGNIVDGSLVLTGNWRDVNFNCASDTMPWKNYENQIRNIYLCTDCLASPYFEYTDEISSTYPVLEAFYYVPSTYSIYEFEIMGYEMHYIDNHYHNLELHDLCFADMYNEGNIKYYYCEECNKCYLWDLSEITPEKTRLVYNSLYERTFICDDEEFCGSITFSYNSKTSTGYIGNSILREIVRGSNDEFVFGFNTNLNDVLIEFNGNQSTGFYETEYNPHIGELLDLHITLNDGVIEMSFSLLELNGEDLYNVYKTLYFYPYESDEWMDNSSIFNGENDDYLCELEYKNGVILSYSIFDKIEQEYVLSSDPENYIFLENVGKFRYTNVYNEVNGACYNIIYDRENKCMYMYTDIPELYCYGTELDDSMIDFYMKLEEVPKEYEEEWNWSDNFSEAWLTLTPSNFEGESVTLEADVTNEIIKEPTFEEKGLKKCTATVIYDGNEFTDSKTVEIDKLVLVAPTVTTGKNYGNGILVEWDAVEHATGYVVYRRAMKTGETNWTAFARWNNTTELSFLDTKVYEGTKYQYGIKAYYGNDPATTTKLGPVGPMSKAVIYAKKPGKTTSTSVSNTEDGILVKWTPVSGATGYIIYRRAWNLESSGWTEFKRWNNTRDTEWLDTKVYAGTRYQYGIKAYYGPDPQNMKYVGEVGPLATNVRITSRKIISVTKTSKGFNIKWSPSSLFTGYQLQYSTNSTFKDAKTVTIDNPKTSSKEITVDNTKMHYFRIRSYHVFNDITYYGGWTVATSPAFTMRYGVNEIPSNWNSHKTDSNSLAIVAENAEDTLYKFDFNENRDGYQIVPSMASAMPKDVTSQYVGRFGITSSSENQVYEISLKQGMKYDNGDQITANCFVESAKRLLDPQAENERAIDLFSKFLIYGAENYFRQGKFSLLQFVSENYGDDEYVDPSEFTADGDGVLQYNGFDIILDINSGGNWGGSGLAEYAAAGYLEGTDYETLSTEADENGLVRLTAETLRILQDCIAKLHGFDSVDEYAAATDDYAYQEFEEMVFLGGDWPSPYRFEDVGFFAKDEYTLVIVFTKPLYGSDLMISLINNVKLVHVPTYDACTKTENGIYSNTYGTSVDTYVGYGPYKLTEFCADESMSFARNEFWHGYFEAEHEGQYQTTNITYKQVSEISERLEMFLKGELEIYNLTRDDMETYHSSASICHEEGDSTWYIALNPNESALQAAEEAASPVTAGNTVVKRILCIKEFRQALSFSVDRAAYQLTLDPTGIGAYGIYGYKVISDVENGTVYRNTDAAKSVLADNTGTFAQAKSLFNTAYDKAVEVGYIPADSDAWEIQIIIGQPGSGSSSYYNNGYLLLKQLWTDAVTGTKLEGHLVFTQSQPLGSSAFSSYLKNNSIDLLFGVGWTGSALNPYDLIQAFVEPQYQYDPAIDYTTLPTTVKIDGTEYTAATYDWYLALTGETITAKAASGAVKRLTAGTEAENSLRLNILAAIEGTVLQQYTMIPAGRDATALLKGKRISFGAETPVYGIGFGGLQYITYSMDDLNWSNYVKDNGGTIDYR